MARRFDTILVIDVESTCWRRGDPIPPGEKSEIIEVGLCTLDGNTLERQQKKSYLIKPIHSTVSPFCTELTSITPQMLERDGIPFEAVLSTMRETFKSHQRVWASWGDYDRSQFRRVCNMYRLPYPFGKTHINVKTLFALAKNLSHEVGMDKAFGLMGWELEGTHHRGDDDAWNISKALAYILKRTRGLHGK